MARIQPFRAFRYDLGRVGLLGDVIAPPYDLLDPDDQLRYLGRSKYNVVHVDLHPERIGDDDIVNRYTRSARLWKDWRHEGAVVQDSARGLYVIHQEFSVEGRTYTRRAMVARVRLERFGEGSVFPHEKTFPGPKLDRLKLMRATGMNFSPIFGLYPDDAGEVQTALDDAVFRKPPVEATDDDGVITRLWPVTDSSLISAVVGQMGPKPLFIADGHHRYETALYYRDELRPEAADHPANFTLMALVGMSDPGLVILPTHRLIGGIPTLSRQLLAERLHPYFDWEPAADCRSLWELMQIDGTQAGLGFGTADGWLSARLRDPEVMRQFAPDRNAEWRSLGVAVLHQLVIDRLIGGDATCRYVHQIDEVEAAINGGEVPLAALVPPVSMAHVEAIARGGDVMPQKSTYFYPKLPTGLVFNSLTSD